MRRYTEIIDLKWSYSIDSLLDMVGKIGEKLDVSQVATVEGKQVIVYNHPGNKLTALLALSSAKAVNIHTVGKDVAMQIAAMKPVAIDKDSVDAKTIERELEIARDLARQEGKPEDMVEKIAQGRLNKFFKEETLLSQNFIKDDKLTIAQLLESTEKGLKVTAFQRIQLGA